MAKNTIKTRPRIASKASKLLKKGKDLTTRSVAGSDLVNAKSDPSRKKK